MYFSESHVTESGYKDGEKLKNKTIQIYTHTHTKNTTKYYMSSWKKEYSVLYNVIGCDIQ